MSLCLKFSALAAAWQADKPIHSQSAILQNFKAEFMQHGSPSFAQSCRSCISVSWPLPLICPKWGYLTT